MKTAAEIMADAGVPNMLAGRVLNLNMELKRMTTVIIDNTSITVPDGSSVSIRNNKVYVNGKEWDNGPVAGVVRVELSGDIKSVDTDASLHVTGDINGPANVGGSVNCGSIMGHVTAGGSVKCGTVGGRVNAGGSVTIK